MSKKGKSGDVVSTWGVDLTSVGLRAVQLDIGRDGKPRIVAWDIVDFTEESSDIQSLSRFQIIARGIYHLHKRHDFSRSRVFASVRGEAAFNRTVQIPSINDESLEKILHYEALHQIPYPLDQVYWDRRVISIAEDGGIRATLYAIQKEIIDERVRKLEKIGFPVDALQVRPIALDNFCAAEHLLEEGTVVVDVDYMGTQVLIHHDQHSWFRVVPVGGVDMVQKLKDAFGCDHRAAVRMLRGDEKIPDKDTVLRLREEVAEFLANEVGRIVDFYLAARPEVEVNNLVLFRSHRCVPPMVKALKKRLGLPVFRPAGFRRVNVHPDVVSAGIQEKFPELVRGVGLALQGIGKAEVDVRLFSPDLHRPVARNVMGYAAGILLVLALLVTAGIERSSKRSDIEASVARLKSIEESSQRLGDLGEQGELDALVARMEELGGLADNRNGPLVFIEDLMGRIDHAKRPIQIASLQVGREAGLPDGQAMVVLATAEDGAGSRLDDEMDELLKGLRASPEGTWTAGEVSPDEPQSASEVPLRWRFRHRRYRIVLEGGKS